MIRGRPSSTRGRRAGVSASELAQMGVCERLVLFEHRYGSHRSAQQRAAMARGDREHRRFFLEGQLERRGRCFIATQPRPATSQAVWIMTSGALRPVSKWRGGRRTSTPEETHAISFRPGYPKTPRACIDVALPLGAIAESARDMTVGWLLANLGVADSNILG